MVGRTAALGSRTWCDPLRAGGSPRSLRAPREPASLRPVTRGKHEAGGGPLASSPVRRPTLAGPSGLKPAFGSNGDLVLGDERSGEGPTDQVPLAPGHPLWWVGHRRPHREKEDHGRPATGWDPSHGGCFGLSHRPTPRRRGGGRCAKGPRGG